MSNHFFENTSVPFLMDLYRTRKSAEKRKDTKALVSLKQHFPELFSEEVDIFFEQFKKAAQVLDLEQGTQFSAAFESEGEAKESNVH